MSAYPEVVSQHAPWPSGHHRQPPVAGPNAPGHNRAGPNAPDPNPPSQRMPGKVVRSEVVATPSAPDSGAPPANLMAAMLADPVHAPERLALEAVRLCGPEAARWVDKTRRARPDATTADLAMAIRFKFTRLSQMSGAATGALGLPGAAADVCVAAWSKARMIVYLAALHHLDPTHEERAAEILYFTGVYKGIRTAEQAIEVAKKRAPVSTMFGNGGRAGPKAVVALVFSLGKMLGRYTVKKVITRAIPFGSIPVSAWANGRGMTELADRVVTEYARRLGVVVHHRAIKR